MLNEGIIRPDIRQLMKTEMIRELHELGGATPLHWQHAVFKRCTGEDFSELDWEVEDNKAGYFMWTKTFDGLITELEEDGYLTVEKEEDGSVLVSTEKQPDIEVSQMNYPRPG